MFGRSMACGPDLARSQRSCVMPPQRNPTPATPGSLPRGLAYACVLADGGGGVAQGAAGDRGCSPDWALEGRTSWKALGSRSSSSRGLQPAVGCTSPCAANIIPGSSTGSSGRDAAAGAGCSKLARHGSCPRAACRAVDIAHPFTALSVVAEGPGAGRAGSHTSDAGSLLTDGVAVSNRV